MTLKEAVNAALEGNPALRAGANSVRASEEDIGIARSNLLPKLRFEERFMRTNNPTFAFSSKLNQERFSQADFAIDSLNDPAEINDFQTSVSIEQPLYVRKANIGLRMARKEYAADLKEFDRKKEQVVFEVVKTYLGAHAAREFIGVADQAVEDATEHLRVAKLRYDSGLGLYSDVLRAETEVKSAEQQRVTAEKNYKVAARALGLLIGTGESVTISDAVDGIALKDYEYYTRASTNRSDLESMRIRAENARNNISLARSDYFPVLGAGGSYFLNDHSAPFAGEGESWQVSAFLRWNIFDGTLRRHQSSKAKHQAMEAAEHLSGLKKSVSFNIYRAYLEVEEARSLTALSEAALKSAEEGERLVRVRYENSLSPIVDLLDASVNLNRARANHVLKKSDEMTSIAELSFQSGTLLTDLGLEQ